MWASGQCRQHRSRSARLRADAGGCDGGVREKLAGDHLMAPGDDYVRFSEYEDALASLELVALVAALVRDKPQYWKWVIVAAHDALQGAMVCACAVGTGSSVLEKKSAKKKSAKEKSAKEKLAPFGRLLKWCIAGRKPILEPLVLTPKQRKDIERLHDHFRNDFAHFVPQGWG